MIDRPLALALVVVLGTASLLGCVGGTATAVSSVRYAQNAVGREVSGSLWNESNGDSTQIRYLFISKQIFSPKLLSFG